MNGELIGFPGLNTASKQEKIGLNTIFHYSKCAEKLPGRFENDWWTNLHWQWKGKTLKLFLAIGSYYFSFFSSIGMREEKTRKYQNSFRFRFDNSFCIIHSFIPQIFLCVLHYFTHRYRWNYIILLVILLFAIGISFLGSSYFTIDGCIESIIHSNWIDCWLMRGKRNNKPRHFRSSIRSIVRIQLKGETIDMCSLLVTRNFWANGVVERFCSHWMYF